MTSQFRGEWVLVGRVAANWSRGVWMLVVQMVGCCLSAAPVAESVGGHQVLHFAAVPGSARAPFRSQCQLCFSIR